MVSFNLVCIQFSNFQKSNRISFDDFAYSDFHAVIYVCRLVVFSEMMQMCSDRDFLVAIYVRFCFQHE